MIVTKDEDFTNMLALSEEAPVIVWVRLGNTRRQVLLDWFQPQLDPIIKMVDAGNRLIELR